MEIACIVLAGGKSVRLGRDKVLESVGKKSLLEQVVLRVSHLANNVIIVTSEERSTFPLTDYPEIKIKIVTDIYPGKGPLVGIYTGLVSSASFYNLVVASDMPFLNEALLRYMVQVSPGFDMVVPRVGDLVEPLHAVYSRDCLQLVERMIKEGKFGVHKLHGRLKTRYVEAEEIERFDPHHLSFFNINTKEDLEKARQLAGGDLNQ